MLLVVVNCDNYIHCNGAVSRIVGFCHKRFCTSESLLKGLRESHHKNRSIHRYHRGAKDLQPLKIELELGFKIQT